MRFSTRSWKEKAFVSLLTFPDLIMEMRWAISISRIIRRSNWNEVTKYAQHHLLLNTHFCNRTPFSLLKRHLASSPIATVITARTMHKTHMTAQDASGWMIGTQPGSLSSALGKQERKPFILELTCGQRNKAKCMQRLYPRASASMCAKSAFNFLFKLLPPTVCLENLRFLGEKSSFPDGALCHFTEI